MVRATRRVFAQKVAQLIKGVDLGERVLATIVLLRQDSASAPPRFYGKGARGVRRLRVAEKALRRKKTSQKNQGNR